MLHAVISISHLRSTCKCWILSYSFRSHFETSRPIYEASLYFRILKFKIDVQCINFIVFRVLKVRAYLYTQADCWGAWPALHEQELEVHTIIFSKCHARRETELQRERKSGGLTVRTREFTYSGNCKVNPCARTQFLVPLKLNLLRQRTRHRGSVITSALCFQCGAVLVKVVFCWGTQIIIAKVA